MTQQESQYVKTLEEKITAVNLDIARNSDNDHIVERHIVTREKLEKEIEKIKGKYINENY